MLTSLQQWFLQFDPTFRPMLTAFMGLIGPTMAALVALAALRFTRWKHTRDAEMALRKEVYANASDVIAEAMFVLTHMLLPLRALEESTMALQKFAGSLGKLLTVSRPETQAIVLQLQRSFMAAFGDLARRKGLLSGRSTRLEAIEAALKQRANDREDALEFRKARLAEPMIETGKLSKNKSLEERLEIIAQSVELLASERAELVQQNVQEFLTGMEAVNAFLQQLQPLNVDLLLAFRSELGVPTNVAWFRKEMTANFVLAVSDAKGAIEAERSKLADFISREGTS